jgi:hypothetical protein
MQEPQKVKSSTPRVNPGWRPRDLHILLSPEAWLSHNTPMHFLDITGKYVQHVASQQDINACFAARGIKRPEDRRWWIPLLLDVDVASISHAQLLPDCVRKITDKCGVKFDHIGVEIFGKLEWYVELFGRAYAANGIDVVREHVFPSVQVRKALEYDPDLADVRIARIHFRHRDSNVNLELFEATQSWQYIALRQASLYASLAQPSHRAKTFTALAQSIGGPLEPVGHSAFRVPDAEIVEQIQAVVVEQSSKSTPPEIRPYADRVSFNPAEGSTNTKFVVRTTTPSGEKIDSQILEILSYQA